MTNLDVVQTRRSFLNSLLPVLLQMSELFYHVCFVLFFVVRQQINNQKKRNNELNSQLDDEKRTTQQVSLDQFCSRFVSMRGNWLHALPFGRKASFETTSSICYDKVRLDKFPRKK